MIFKPSRILGGLQSQLQLIQHGFRYTLKRRIAALWPYRLVQKVHFLDVHLCVFAIHMTLRPPSPDSDASATVPAALNPPQPDKAASIVAANGQSPTIPPLNSSHLARIPAKLKAVPSLGSLPLPPAPSSGQGQAQKNPARRSGNNPIHAARRPPPSSSTSYFANGKMPKASGNPVLPLNGLFPIAKPSGPPSMRLIDSITPLLLDSKLFYDPDRMRMPDNKKRKSNLTHMGLKIGQGGTLDPLADGVLGASCLSFSFRQPTGVLRCNSEDEVAAELLIHCHITV